MRLSQYGFLEPRGGLALSEGEAAALASQVGYPVALKIVSPDVLHKTDIGGVALGLASEESVRTAYRRVLGALREHRPEAGLDGVRVEEMVPGGTEFIIGLKQDDQFGPVIMFGLGGVFTELLDEVSFRVLPITRVDAGQMIGETVAAGILGGFRGRLPVSSDVLIDLLLKTARLGLDLGDELEAVDLNPVLIWGSEHRVLDAKVVLRGLNRKTAEPAAYGGAVPAPNIDHLELFFRAQSVALVGASAVPGKVGQAVLASLAQHEYRGEIFPVNPSKESILGLKAYPTLADVPAPVDLVICTVDLAAAPELVRVCAARGIHNLIIVSGGGKELGGERATLEAEIRHTARALGVRIIGPNCVGVFDGTSCLDTFFQPHERMVRPPAGPVAMMTQSGTVGIAFLEDMVTCGVSKFVSYGNRVDVDEADLLTYLAEDDETKLIAMYVEGFENGRGFLEAARRVTARKPVVIFKSGRTPSASQAARSHTGSLAGSYKVLAGAFRQTGLIAVDSYEELVAVSKALALQPRAAGHRVAMMGNGIGTIVQALDLLGNSGLTLALPTPETLARLAQVYPSFYVVQNPLDITGSGTSADYEVGIGALLEDPGVDMVMPWFVFQDAPLGMDIPEVMGRLNRSAAKPILGAAMGGAFTARLSAEIEAQGVPIFHSVRDWVAAARGLAPP